MKTKTLIALLLLLMSTPSYAFKPTCEYLDELCAFDPAEGCKQITMSDEQYQALKQFNEENCGTKNMAAVMAPIISLVLSEDHTCRLVEDTVNEDGAKGGRLVEVACPVN